MLDNLVIFALILMSSYGAYLYSKTNDAIYLATAVFTGLTSIMAEVIVVGDIVIKSVS